MSNPKALPILTENVKLLQKIVLIHQDKFLVLRRHPQALTRPNQWDLPGGNAVWPDSQVDIKNPHWWELVREVKEEAGLDISSQQRQCQLCYAGTYFEAEKNMMTIILGYVLVLADEFRRETVKQSDEHTAQKWISESEFEDIRKDFGFAGDDDGFITQMVNNAFALTAHG